MLKYCMEDNNLEYARYIIQQLRMSKHQINRKNVIPKSIGSFI